MEILTYVLSGAVAHRDSMGNVTQVAAGEFQIMSAGTGITHSEFNPRKDQELHLYQIWIQPDTPKLTPRYAQQRFDAGDGWQLILSPEAVDGSLRIYQAMRLWRGAFSDQFPESEWTIAPGRRVWIQGVRGRVEIDGQSLAAGDGLAVWEESELRIRRGSADAEILLFELP